MARAVREVLEQEPLARIDYVSVVDAGSLQPVSAVERDVLVALAVYIGNTRLIDNINTRSSRRGYGDYDVTGENPPGDGDPGELHYVGSVTVDRDLLDAAGILEYQQVQVGISTPARVWKPIPLPGNRGAGSSA